MPDHDAPPPLHTVHVERVPYGSWVLAGIETLPPGWVNVRLFDHDKTLGLERYTVETCPGVLHFESTAVEIFLQNAAPGGDLFDEFGVEYDEHPDLIGTRVADPPHRYHYHVAPDWRNAILGGGYLGTCLADRVPELLAAHQIRRRNPQLLAGGDHQ